jgi:hypothetical protein
MTHLTELFGVSPPSLGGRMGGGDRRETASSDGRWRYECYVTRSVLAVQRPFRQVVVGRPQQDSNLRTRLRRPLLYPLSYGGWRTDPLRTKTQGD